MAALQRQQQPQEVTLDQLRDGLPTRAIVDLQRALPHKLIGHDGQKRVLDATWQQVERAVKGLGRHVQLGQLRRAHLLELGGLIVAPHYWLSLQ